MTFFILDEIQSNQTIVFLFVKFGLGPQSQVSLFQLNFDEGMKGASVYGLLFLVLHNYIRGMNATFCILPAHVTLTIVL